MIQMAELQQWGVMTDWRYSYFTMMPDYQATVLRCFSELIGKGYVTRGHRPVFWSVSQQKVLAEEEMMVTHEISDCAILKLRIESFGKKGQQIRELYPDAKLLAFISEPWQAVGMAAVGVNEKLIYTLAKWRNEHVIVAEKRLGEL